MMRRARWWSTAFRCLMSRMVFTWRSLRMGGSALRRTLHPKNLVPLAHLEHGGAFADTLTLFGADVGKPVEIPLDELERYAVRPFGIAITPDKIAHVYHLRRIGDALRSIDIPRLMRYVRTHPGTSRAGSLGERELCDGAHCGGPRSARRDADATMARKLLVANRLEDTISVIDTKTNRVASTIALAGPKQMSVLRHGEQTFYTSRYSFQGQIGCANCHIDSTFDGLQWDLEPDGFGRDIVDNRPIEAVKDTEPFKWNGGNPNLPTECGPRTEKYFWRSENYDDLTLTDLVVYVRRSAATSESLAAGRSGELTPAQERGQRALRARVGQVWQLDSGDESLSRIATAGRRARIRSPSMWARRRRPTTQGCSIRRS